MLGEAFCDQLLALKWAEWDQYQQHVSSWELVRYADAF
jgi:glutamine synthetase